MADELKEGLLRKWEEFRKRPVPWGLTEEFKADLALLGSYVAGLITSYLSSASLEVASVNRTNHDFELLYHRIETYSPASLEEEILRLDSLDYLEDLLELRCLLKRCIE